MNDLSAPLHVRGCTPELPLRFRLAFEKAPIGILVRDARMTVLETNKALQEMLGYSEAELAAMDMDTLVHPTDRALGAALDHDLLHGRRDAYQFEERFRHKDGSELWCKVDTSLVRDGHGRPYVAVSTVEDITDRKHVEEAIRRTLSRYELIFNAIRCGIVGVGTTGSVVFANRAALDMLEWDGDALIGEPIDRILQAGAIADAQRELRGAIRGAIDDGLIRHAGHCTLTCRSGGLLPAECTVAPLVDDGRISGAALIFGKSERRSGNG